MHIVGSSTIVQAHSFNFQSAARMYSSCGLWRQQWAAPVVMPDQRNAFGGDEEHRLAFGDQVDISCPCRRSVDGIRRNSLWESDLWMNKNYVANLSDRAWQLLGRYIANNHHMRVLSLSYLGLQDSKAVLLFQELDRSSVINCLLLQENRIGGDGIRSMVPFLKNAQDLMTVRLCHNENIGVDGFEVLAKALCDRCVERRLFLSNCDISDISAMLVYRFPQLTALDLDENGIQDISALEAYTHLQDLSLRGNDLGRKGCMVVSQLLQNKSSSLIRIELDSSGMGDEEAEMLANSLKHNTKLVHLSLTGGNDINEAGHRAFSKLLNDVSTITATYTSNHTLQSLLMPRSQNAKIKEMNRHIESALTINRKQRHMPEAAGRAKVVATQLNGDTRMQLSDLQDVNYSYEGLFAGIEPVLLPDILRTVGEWHGGDEMYCVLVATLPGLASTAEKGGAPQGTTAREAATATALDTDPRLRRIAALGENTVRLDAKMFSIESGGNNRRVVDDRKRRLCSRKRRRVSAGF